jgi:rubrerythrin
MKTAVEWLFEQVWITSGEDLPELLEQAKEMEKEQKKCYHPLTERKYTSDTHFECTICGDNNY